MRTIICSINTIIIHTYTHTYLEHGIDGVLSRSEANGAILTEADVIGVRHIVRLRIQHSGDEGGSIGWGRRGGGGSGSDDIVG